MDSRYNPTTPKDTYTISPLSGKRLASIVNGLPVLIMALTMLSLPFPVFAIGDIAISPTRIVFEGRDRTARISLTNTSATTKTYRISWARKRMNEAGKYEDINSALPQERFSDTMIRFSPRQVTLPPGKPQVVRLLLRKPNGLPDGEYRSYLRFTAIPDTGGRSLETTLNAGQGDMSIRLTPVMSLSIPVIVRQGQTRASVKLTQLSLKNRGHDNQRLVMVFERSGNRSLYGDVIATYHPANGQTRVVGQAIGVAIYPPLERRRFELPLAAEHLSNGRLEVRFRAREASGSHTGNAVMATAGLTLP